MRKKAVWWTLGIAVSFMLVRNMPDIVRYMKIRSM